MEIRLTDISHTFYSKQTGELHSLENINLSVNSGDFVAIIGPSGCGKSTLLRIIAGLLTPLLGSVDLDSSTPTKMVEQKRIAWLAQNPALLPWSTVRENIKIAQQINPQERHRTIEVNDLLNKVGLTEFGDAYPFELSGGMHQRVALARTIALGSDLWLMDEPYAGLDELNREKLTKELREFSALYHPTTLWVTHHIYEAVHLADVIVVMSDRPGKILDQLEINLPYPRDESSEEFQEQIKKLRYHLKVLHG